MYVTQLKEVFDSCDATGTGSLNEEELRILCERLHLVDHTDILIHHLLKSEDEVKFEDFKECFVAVLTQAIPSGEEASETENSEEVADREVSPKFTLGRKKYGRRSRPASIADEDGSAVSPMLSPQGSFDQASSGETAVKFPVAENAPGKRPMSPNASQQPPTKSGRMTDEKVPVPGATQVASDADLSPSFNSNPVQYLQETWKKLNIGQSGFLNVEELALVCEHIGMDMTEEVISQLFEKLDCDQDGQISFDEFLQGLFQHGDPQDCDSPIMKSTPSMFGDGSRDDHQITNSSVSGIFSCIDPDNTGFAESSAILELWETLLELPCAPQLLEELGFDSRLKINLSDLTSVLEEVLCNAFKRPVLQLAFLTYQNEMQFLRQSQEQMHRERRRLRASVEEANSRAALLAQEVDDNHARLETSLQEKLRLLERKYQDQARVLSEELQRERESMGAQTSRLKQQLQLELEAAREEEGKLKARLQLLQQENSRLEQELHEASEKFLEAQKLNEVLQKELLIVPDLKQRLADLESQANDLQEESHQNLLRELERYKKSGQELQDKIDELTLEMESLQQQTCASDATPSKAVNRTHSWLSDYRRSGYKRRGSESSSEENSDEESRTTGKLRRTFLSNGSQIHEAESPTLPADDKKTCAKGCVVRPSSVDVLLKDLLQDQASLLRKLQIAEEGRLRTERAFRQAETKNRVLSGIVRSMSGAVSA